MITFQNIDYKSKTIFLSDFGNVLISTNSLNEKLLNNFGSYTSEEAFWIDEQIFFFVEDIDIDLPISKLTKLILKQVK